MSSPDVVLDFWLGAPASNATAFREKIRRWFVSSPQLDAEIRARFAGDNDAARAGKLDGWAATAKGRLALIIVLDQFTRNLYRRTPRAFSADAKALALALEGIDRGEDAELHFEESIFLYAPLGHAEDLPLQERHLALIERKAAGAPPAMAEAWSSAVAHARGYVEQIAQFGRFPHRNVILDRTSTADEVAFLAKPATTG
jgi:uncharacterized protein (DUF924 family)